MLNVIEVRHVREFVLWLRFSNGAEGEVDLRDAMTGAVFEPLRDVHEFAKVVVDDEIGTVCWPNGADLAPEFLIERLTSRTTA